MKVEINEEERVLLERMCKRAVDFVEMILPHPPKILVEIEKDIGLLKNLIKKLAKED
jgi:hypothetical protein